MAISIGELAGTISLNDQFSAPINNVAKSLGMTSESFQAVTGFAGLAAGAIVGTTAALVALGTRGAAVADVQGAFDNLTSAAGSSADVMLGELRAGTLGTISDFDLMSKANAVLGSGMVRTAEDMGTLAAGAKLLADRTGGDTSEAFDTLTGAMASGRVATLKQMGVFVDTKGAIQDYANALGVSVDKLTAEQRAEAISTATLAALKAQLQAAGPATADFADQMDRGKVMVQNFTDNLGKAIATSPVVAAGMDAISKGVQAAFGSKNEDMIKAIMGFVNGFAIQLVDVAQVAVTGAGLFISAWHGIQTVVLGVIAAVSLVTTAIVAYVDGIVQLSSKVPGLSDVTEGLRAGSAALAADMKAVTLSLAGQTAEAAKGVLGNSDLHRSLDGVSNTLAVMKTTMEAAAGATAAMGSKVVEIRKPIEDLGTTINLTAAQLQKLTEETQTALDAQNAAWQAGADFQTNLQNQLALMRTSGVERQLLEAAIVRDREMADLNALTLMTVDEYETRKALIQQHYQLLVDLATGANRTVAQVALAAGFQTRAALTETADRARELWADMVASGEFSAEQIRAAFEASEKAKQALAEGTTSHALERFNMMASAASSILGDIFGKNKTAAIAAAIIDTAAAVVASFRNAGGWPWGLIPAAAMAAAGAAQIQTIRSQEAGFAQGTGPGGMFVDFGKVSTVDVHGSEAIVTRPQGESIAEMVRDELQLRDDRMEKAIEGLRDDMDHRDRVLPILLQSMIQMAKA